MLEFANKQWLWLFALMALFYVAWMLARRFRPRRVTYGMIWRRVAARMLPPAWKRILKTVLTLLLATVMLAAAAAWGAGLQRPAAEQPPPLLCVIVLDNNPAMRAKAGETTRRELASRRAAEIINALGPDDRVAVAWFKEGAPMISNWLAAGETISVPPTDFAPPDLDALAEYVAALKTPSEEPAPQPLVIWLGNVAPQLPRTETPPRLAGFGNARDLGGTPLFFEAVGTPAHNDALTALRWSSPTAFDEHAGIIEAETLSGNPPQITVEADGEILMRERAASLALPSGRTNLRVTARVTAIDDLPDDDSAVLEIRPRAVADVALCYPAADGGPNVLLKEALESFLPGREIRTFAIPGESPPQVDLLVCDRALPDTIRAGALLCFGVLPAEYGVIGTAVRADPNLLLPAPTAKLAFEAPDLSLLSADEAWPLTAWGDLAPLAVHIEGGVLAAAGGGDQPVLYSGFVPHESTLLHDRSGLLLLLRWIESLQQPAERIAPPVVATGETLVVNGAAELRPTRLWSNVYEPPGLTLSPGPDGRVRVRTPEIPGRWLLTTAAGATTLDVLWRDETRQSLPLDEGIIQAAALTPEHKSDWRDLLPGLLLWIALGVLLIEWLLWLSGVTE